MSLQAWSSFDNLITQWTTIGFEESVDIGDVAHVTIIT